MQVRSGAGIAVPFTLFLVRFKLFQELSCGRVVLAVQTRSAVHVGRQHLCMTRLWVSLGRAVTDVTADDVMLASDSEARIGGLGCVIQRLRLLSIDRVPSTTTTTTTTTTILSQGGHEHPFGEQIWHAILRSCDGSPRRCECTRNVRPQIPMGSGRVKILGATVDKNGKRAPESGADVEEM